MYFGSAGPIYGAICIGSLTCANREIGVPRPVGCHNVRSRAERFNDCVFMVRQSPDWRLFGLKQALT